MTKFFSKFKIPYIWPSFGENFFFKKSGPVTHSFIWVSSTMQKLRKNYDGVMLEIYLDHKFLWLQEGLNCESVNLLHMK